MKQKNYWDNAAMKKEFTTPFKLASFKRYVKPNDKILDYGCGYGRTIDLLHKNGFQNLYGVDFSDEMIVRAKHENPVAEYHVIKNNMLHFEENFFDAVLLLAVLTCIIANWEQEALMKELKRILKPDGIIYVNDFLLNTDNRNIERYKKYQSKYNYFGVFELEEGAILRHFSENRITKLTDGFQTLKYEQLLYTTMNKNKSNGFYYIGKNI